MRILNINNVITAASITSSSDAVGYEAATALKDSRLCRFWKTIGCASENVVFDFTTAKAITYVCLMGTNLTAGATITIQGNATNAWGAPSFTSSAFSIKGNTASVNFVAQTYRYWRLVVADGSNPDTVIKIGLIFIGGYSQFPSMAPDQQIPRNTTSDVGFSVMGQAYGDKRIRYKTATINFPVVTNTELSIIDAVFEANDITDPLICIFWANNLDVEPPLYCVLSKGHEPKRIGNYSGCWSASITFRECK